jgi:hypothetical protein
MSRMSSDEGGWVSWADYVEGGGLTSEQEDAIVDVLCQFPEFIVVATASEEGEDEGEDGAC